VALLLLQLSVRLDRRIRSGSSLNSRRRILRSRFRQLGPIHLNLTTADSGAACAAGIGQRVPRHNLAGFFLESLDRDSPVHDSPLFVRVTRRALSAPQNGLVSGVWLDVLVQIDCCQVALLDEYI